MNIKMTIVAVSAYSLLPIMAQADGLVLSAGVAATAAFDTSDGLEHAENTVEGYIEGELNGFHGGIWIGSLYKDPADDAEIELSLGYGADINDTLGYDITTTGYYLNNGGYQSYDIAFELSAALTDSTSGALGFAWDPDASTIETTLGLEHALNDKFTLAGEIGHSEADGNIFGEIGVSYALTDSAAIELLYEDADDSAGTLSLTVSYDFNLMGG
ncbi:hypothetical protein TG4357_00151 [Thalassovita gelatinovora]|uniref:Outer membrane protein beta-barrel domain-containing protein n=1 Tax=Thalassovita gelatinovora TaxID=53501 RepID=A0A0P1FMZ5_THAGE|nr:hypothetical protein [Thalassovita gelatinovora]QIZ79290.1 hypothetical protein HFZ77_01800 [Thalassovita gelatinovora]CUH62513.1 hypothetical protein TG4357_00151 [Thalassovita gelatinovora]SEQ05752.1 hypothetical protein SAMN04488043_10351 [Thalassovita gelatinovora]